MTIAIAAPHAEAVAAGERVVAAGGNALDAALAAAVMLTVVYPHQCALGGDLIALVRDPAGETTAVVAAGTAPRAVMTAAAGWSEVPRQGVHSVTVPGVVAGWQAVARLGATRDLAAAFADAERVAEQGTPVSAGLARALAARREAVLADEGLRGVFAPGGVVLAEGAVLVQPALARTLRRLAGDPTDLYRGRTAAALVAHLRAAGGTHDADDFASFEPEVVDALTRRIGDAVWTVAPPPSAGALLLGVAAAADGSPGDGALVDAAVAGVAARAAHLGDPRGGRVDVEGLLRLDAGRRAAASEPRPSGDTVAVAALDDDGWGVTIVQSVYQTFGAGTLDPETGIVLHNRASAFSVDPASPAAIAPGARPPHTLCPAIVDRGEVTVVAGCQGGRAQAWILSQVLPAATDPRRGLPQILARPRWVVGDRDLGQPALSLVAEPGVPDDAVEQAVRDGLAVVHWPRPADEAGHVQLVRRTPAGVEAASDPRADGVGMLVG